MQFILIGRDGTDAAALERRMKVRAAHIESVDKMKAEGRALFGTALLDDAEKMCGSVMLLDFPDRAALDAWLKTEPYVTGKVWENVEIHECRTGPSFEKTLEMMKAK